MKNLKARAELIAREGEFIDTTGTGIWRNHFYRHNGFLVNVQHKNGKLFDIINYGKIGE